MVKIMMTLLMVTLITGYKILSLTTMIPISRIILLIPVRLIAVSLLPAMQVFTVLKMVTAKRQLTQQYKIPVQQNTTI